MASVKICGITNESDLRAAIEAGADRVGFVLVAESPRRVSLEDLGSMALIARALRHAPQRCEVWLVASISTSGGRADLEPMIERLPEASAVQLHGRERPQEVALLKQRYPLIQLVKAIGIASKADLDRAKSFEAADMILLDAKPPQGADREGGHGRAFDWRLLEGFDPGKPWILSGGLNPANVAEAVRISGARAVDVSSGVEARAGVKDHAKVKAFIAAAKGL